MHGIERMAEPEEVAEIRGASGTPSPVAIGRVRRTRDRAEGDGVAAEHHAALRVARMQGETLGRKTDDAFDERLVEAYPVRSLVDIGAGLFQDRLRFLVEEVHADFGEDGERRLMNGFELIFRNGGNGRERQARLRRP